jgi:hypothetical protein
MIKNESNIFWSLSLRGLALSVGVFSHVGVVCGGSRVVHVLLAKHHILGVLELKKLVIRVVSRVLIVVLKWVYLLILHFDLNLYGFRRIQLISFLNILGIFFISFLLFDHFFIFFNRRSW